MTKNDLREYIKEELGAPVINVEVADKQIDNQIDKAVKKFTDFAYGCDCKKYIKFKCEGKGQYTIDGRVKSITKISRGGNFFTTNLDGLVPDAFTKMIQNGSGAALGVLTSISSTRATLDHFFYDSIHFNFNEQKHKLDIYEDYHGLLLIEAFTEYIPDEHDDIYDHPWVKEYSTELTRLIWANNVGKYSQNLVGGATINAGDIRSQAESAIEKLNEELTHTWMDPPPILIG